MSSINQEFLPLYRIQSFGKICRYAPYFLIKDYTYRSIWRNSMHQTLRHFSRIFTEIFQESSENIPRIFFFSFFFFFRFFQESFFCLFAFVTDFSFFIFISFLQGFHNFLISFFRESFLSFSVCHGFGPISVVSQRLTFSIFYCNIHLRKLSYKPYQAK